VLFKILISRFEVRIFCVKENKYKQIVYIYSGGFKI